MAPSEHVGGLGDCPTCGKVLYSWRGARTVADRMRKRGEPVEAYKARGCNGWHVGHHPTGYGSRSRGRRKRMR